MTHPALHGVDAIGYALVRDFLTADEKVSLAKALGDVESAGRRGVIELPPVAALANSSKLRDLVSPHTGENPRAVRAIAFNKSRGANWLVAWHQDLSIAVREQREVPGFDPWSVKRGVHHVQPPVELLERILAVRIHLDAADETNGALRVLPCTHRLGRLQPDQIGALSASPTSRPQLIVVAAGDALLMRPLLLHASARATNPRSRRVLHLEYAGFELPGGLQWHHA